MEIKLKNVIFTNGFIQALQRILQKEMSSAGAYVLGKFSAEVDKNAAIFQKAHQALLKKYANVDKDGKMEMKGTQADIPAGNREGLEKEFGELIAIEETYELLKKVTLDADAKLTPKDALLLEDVLEIDVK